MTTNWSELKTRERIVKGFINRSVPQLDIELIRPLLVETASGGITKYNEEVIPSQRFGFMPFKRRLVIENWPQAKEFGQSDITDVHWVLIGLPGVDIEKGDYFDKVDDVGLQIGRYYVVFVSARNHDHVQAGLMYHGPDNA